MRHPTQGTPFIWAAWFSLAIVLAGTLAAWAFSQRDDATDLLIEPIPGQILEVAAPDWSEDDATESLVPDEESDGTSTEEREPAPDAGPPTP
jgi:hypothetical protein